MTRTSLEVGFGRLELAEIRSWILPTNLPSTMVTEKMGLRCERDFDFAGLSHQFCRLVIGEWKRYRGNREWFPPY